MKRLKAQVPLRHQAETVRLLQFKIDDRMYAPIEDIEFRTIDEFLNRLKRIFAPHHTVNYYRGQLAALVKKPNEAIIDYTSRVIEIRAAITECIVAEECIDQVSENTVRTIERDIMDGFRNGLPPGFRIQMPGRAHSFEELVDEALRTEKQIDIDNEKHGRFNYAHQSTQERIEDRGPNYRNNNMRDNRE